MPKEESVPQMFENRSGLSRGDDRELPDVAPSARVSRCTSIRLDVPGEPRVLVDVRGCRQRRDSAAGIPRENPPARCSPMSGGRGRLQRSHRRVPALDHLVAVGEGELVVGVDVQPPEQLFLPRRQGAGGPRPRCRPASSGTASSAAPRCRPARRTAARRLDPRCRDGTPRATSADAGRIRNSTSCRVSASSSSRSHASAARDGRSPRDDLGSSTSRRRERAAPARAAPGDRSSPRIDRKRSRDASAAEQTLEAADGEQRVLVHRVLVREVANRRGTRSPRSRGTADRAGRSRASPTAGHTVLPAASTGV